MRRTDASEDLAPCAHASLITSRRGEGGSWSLCSLSSTCGTVAAFVSDDKLIFVSCFHFNCEKLSSEDFLSD